MVLLKHIDTGALKQCTTGYSWTVCLFGFFPMLFRGDLKWAAINFIINLVVGFFTFGLGFLLVNPIMGFFYNKIFIKGLLERRYTYADEGTRRYLLTKDIIMPTLLP